MNYEVVNWSRFCVNLRRLNYTFSLLKVLEMKTVKVKFFGFKSKEKIDNFGFSLLKVLEMKNCKSEIFWL